MNDRWAAASELKFLQLVYGSVTNNQQEGWENKLKVVAVKVWCGCDNAHGRRLVTCAGSCKFICRWLKGIAVETLVYTGELSFLLDQVIRVSQIGQLSSTSDVVFYKESRWEIVATNIKFLTFLAYVSYSTKTINCLVLFPKLFLNENS